MKFIVRFIGPVETFQSVAQVLASGSRYGLKMKTVTYNESLYDKPSIRQRLQHIYSRLGRFALIPQRFLFPNYYIEFIKPE